jgi:hypothetical protein
MDTIAHQSSRPLTVKLALILLLINTGASFVEQVLRADWQSVDWSNPLHYIKWGSEVIMLLVPLWLVFRGINWARWALVVIALLGFCFTLPLLFRQFQAHSFPWIITYFQRNLINVLALVLLFLPQSSHWFRRHTNENTA